VNKLGSVGEALQKWLKNAERIVVVGIGNELRRDDFVGVEIVRGLKGKVSEHVLLIESETVPESFIEPITKFNPTNVLLIDAGLLGLEPGDAKFVESGKVLGQSTVAVSTHALPLRIFCEYLEKTAGAEIALIIMQPKVTDFGEGLSVEVERAAEKLKKILLKVLSSP
jgi:hydrogenase 3 maturation protease